MDYKDIWPLVKSPAERSENTTIFLNTDSDGAFKTILFLFMVLLLGGIVKQVVKKYSLPYTVVLFILGGIFGIISHQSKLVREYSNITEIPARILMQIFLPILIFESAYSMDAHLFHRSIWQCLLLAVPGLVICSALAAGYAQTVLASYKWDLRISFIFGVILSATDPVAVVALLKESGISPTLTTMIEGESLLNDGSAIVIFEVLYDVIKERKTVSFIDFMRTFVRIGVGAPILGYVLGKITVYALLHIYNDAVIEFTITFCSAFLSYYLAEQLGLSGVLTVVTVGVIVSYHKSSFSPATEETVHSFWEMMSYFANTLIFVIVAIIIMQKAVGHLTLMDALLAVATYFAVTLFRFLMVVICSPLLMRLGYGLPWRHGIVLIWGGLRGAVGLALALMLSEDQSVDDPNIADKILIQLSMVIVLTLVVNGITMKRVLQFMGLNEIPPNRLISMAHAVTHLRDVADKSRLVQNQDKFLNDANWLWVESHTYITDPYNAAEEFDPDCHYSPLKVAQCPACLAEHSVTPSVEELKEMSEEAREHVLKALKVCYWKYFEHGLICRENVNILTSAANDASDIPENTLG